MNGETQHVEKKSLRKVVGNSADFAALAADCVCLANAAGGSLFIGLEDGDALPPPDQRIPPGLLDRVRRRIGELTVNVQVAPQVLVAANGGEMLLLSVAPSTGVASTSDGRYFLRVGDICQPVLGDDVLRLLTDRPGAPWEGLTALRATVGAADPTKSLDLLTRLRVSERVKLSVKEKSDTELLQHYGLSDGRWLTNLGVLLLGTATDRARLGSAPIVQVIKYDERGAKVSKLAWDDYTLSPVDLVDAIWRGVSDFRESYEIADGLYRHNVPAYDERVVRELLVNALVHRPYTQRGDIYLNLHPDRLEVVNPGRLPLGVTPRTILHASRRRNDRLATVFHDLRLMEREGSGFDLMYDVQLSQGRAVPEVVEEADAVRVTVRRRIVRPEAMRLISDADARYLLRQRERIALGVLALGEGLTARELSLQLELGSTQELASWLGRLLELGLVQSTGRTQGTRYFVRPDLLRGSGLAAKTTLKRVEPHRLRALIVEDLSRYPDAKSTEVWRRIAPELAPRTVKRALDELEHAELVEHTGDKRWRRYRLTAKGQTG